VRAVDNRFCQITECDRIWGIGECERECGYEIAIAFFHNSDRVCGIGECDRTCGDVGAGGDESAIVLLGM